MPDSLVPDGKREAAPSHLQGRHFEPILGAVRWSYGKELDLFESNDGCGMNGLSRFVQKLERDETIRMAGRC